MMKRILLGVLLGLTSFAAYADDRVISLAGQWQFALGSDMPLVFNDVITLPGTTDTNRKGTPLSQFDETTHLSRRYSYKGRAWYNRQVTIPDGWEEVWLTLERTKYTEVYVDGRLAGSCNDISTPQVYNLTSLLTPGLPHALTIMVSNAEGVPEQIYANSHAYTEDTQTNWNGIIGEMTLSSPREISLCPPSTSSTTQPLSVNGHHFIQNGHQVFLRGRHDACVWPLTGHVPMDLDSWRHYMKICTDYGLNHVRFHSWCPPEAAFTAADEAGIILQPELPFWGDFNANDSVLMAFLHKEGVNILRKYGHHPSFRMFALGNELWGNIDKMADFIDDFRQIAPDKLFTFGSNYYLGYQGVKPGMDYFTTCRVGGERRGADGTSGMDWGNYNTHTRGSFSFADAFDGGMINHFRPNASLNFEEGCQLSSVPVISHETGQFQIYPNYGEIGKYTGVLRPCNLEIFRKRLADAGMADQAGDFHRASGRWAYLLYKQDIEMDLRTPSMAGFQLLDLQDYPGQGSAYVGILEAVLDEKNVCTKEEWRQFCSPVVPLLVCDAYCFTFGEGIHGKVQLANYGGMSLAGRSMEWTLSSFDARSGYAPVANGQMTIPGGEGLLEVGTLDISLSRLEMATRLLLTLKIVGSGYCNTYDLWAYPDQLKMNNKDIVITHKMTDEIGKKLEKGASVLLMPDSSELCVGGLFQTDYWNYRMFKTISENNNKAVSPGTLGILCDSAHPLFRDFPTENHTNWQWWPVIKESHPFMLDHTNPSYRPLVQVIDNIERNHKLGLVFEFKVGKGRLLVVMSNLVKAALYPEGRQFYASVLNYMHSRHFAPTAKVTLQQLQQLFSTKVDERQLRELNNISPY